MSIYGIIAGLLAAAIWGGMYVVSKVVLAVIPPFALLTLRLALGAAALALVLALRRGRMPTRALVLEALAVGLVGFGVSVGLQFVGTALSTAANAALVTSASPAFIVLFGALILRESLGPARLLALVLASLGVMAVIDPRSVDLGSDAFWGNIALLGAALSWGLYSVLVKRVSQRMDTLTVSLLAFLGGLPVSLPLAGGELLRRGVGPLNIGIILGVLYLGLVSTALAMYLWNKSLALLDAGVVSLLFFAQPIVGVGLGAALLGEELQVGFWVGAALIAAGLVLAARSQPGEELRGAAAGAEQLSSRRRDP